MKKYFDNLDKLCRKIKFKKKFLISAELVKHEQMLHMIIIFLLVRKA